MYFKNYLIFRKIFVIKKKILNDNCYENFNKRYNI